MTWTSKRNFSRGYEDRCRAPKIRRGAKQNKKRSSLKFGPIFCPKLGEEQKKQKTMVFTQIWSHIFLPTTR